MSKVNREQMLAFLNRLLHPETTDKDYCPNGLQVEGANNIFTVMTAVSASKRVIEEAVEAGVQALLVHHGIVWNGPDKPLTGIRGDKVRLLMQNNINLFAYHLPLDNHESLGNNILMAKEVIGNLSGCEKHNISVERMPEENMVLLRSEKGIGFEDMLNACAKIRYPENERPATHGVFYGANNRLMHKVAICTGAGHTLITRVSELGYDALISGEVSLVTELEAEENGISYFSCGHHNTEVFGVRALGKMLEEHGIKVVESKAAYYA